MVQVLLRFSTAPAASNGSGNRLTAAVVQRHWVTKPLARTRPTARSGSKIHLLVDQRGAPIAEQITGTNAADKTMVREVVVAIAAKRPT